ncbi:hypothetical protein BDN70DRAFT_939288 [Pholiota conissans]|uniref:MULE transposase domain-containing protein n=1 Tax=Pholiota conissans TaxID=109636 RepID=A0A9P6CLC6_9AGAR|nr:hypothetical protein BDN70DRAFT_939288 [Pholiota conissans]
MASGTRYSVNYHFSKVHLIKLVNNNQKAVQLACALLQHVVSDGFELGSALDHLKSTPILSSIEGFFTASFPLWELGYLLDEGWLHEDALNALIELLYFRHYAQSLKQTSLPFINMPLLLPMLFLSDACVIYSATKPRRFSEEMQNIRHLISTTHIEVVTLPSVQNNHFVGYIYRPGEPTVVHADSLGGAPESDILPILRWVFSGLTEQPIEAIKSVQVSLQGNGNGGEGSCGFAALNFLEHSIDSNITPWTGTMSNWVHNHSPEIPPGGSAPRRPTQEEKKSIGILATNNLQHFSRSHVAETLKAQHAGNLNFSVLEPRQISNIMNKARQEAHEEINQHGGDFQAIINSLQEQNIACPGWQFFFKLDSQSVLKSIFWQTPTQVEIAIRYGDVLINDNTHGRNNVGWPLNIGIVVDGFGHSRNIWYAVHETEALDQHSWVLECHLNTAGYPPTTFISDRHKSLISAVVQVFPMTDHIFCIHHLTGNVELNVCRRIGGDRWPDFLVNFWDTYRSISPEHFDRRWTALIDRFPEAKEYLTEELYLCCTQWAWLFVSHRFTCGVRTNGQVESENRVTKFIGGPKKSLKQLFDGLNEQTNGQTAADMIRACELSRRQHAGPIELTFPGPIAKLREYAGPLALQVTMREMEQSMFYCAESLQLPDGIRDWNEYAVCVRDVDQTSWTLPPKGMINLYDNDDAYISTEWLLQLIRGRGLKVKNLLKITWLSTDSKIHLLALLPNNQVSGFQFHISVIRSRWLQNPDLDTSKVPSVPPFENIPQSLPSQNCPPPPTTTASAPAPAPIPFVDTETISSRTVFHEAQMAITPLLVGVQTRGELTELVEDLEMLRTARQEAAREGEIINSTKDVLAVVVLARLEEGAQCVVK